MESKTEGWLNAVTLAAFTFCPNAGQIAYRRQNTTVERASFRIPNLSYSPIFDPALLLRKIADLKVRLLVWVIVIVAEVCTVIYIADLGYPLFAIVLAVAVAPSLYYSYIDTEHLFKAFAQREGFRASLPVALPEGADLPVAMHWWSIVKLGFAPVYPKPYRDQSSKLMGRPWRILIHEESGERIPVVQHVEHFGNKLSEQIATDSNLFLAACARLIEIHEPSKVRWGVVVDSRSLHAFLVPLDRQTIEDIGNLAATVRDQLLSSRGRPFQLAEPPAGACQFCPLGYPRVDGRQAVIEGKRLRPYLFHLYDVVTWKRFFVSETQTILDRDEAGMGDTDEHLESEQDDHEDGEDDNLDDFVGWLKRSRHRPQPRHCDCGDIFQWTPPHAYWQTKESKARAAYSNWLDRERDRWD